MGGEGGVRLGRLGGNAGFAFASGCIVRGIRYGHDPVPIRG